jgi:HSP20 family protein
VLTISGERRSQSEQRQGGYVRYERSTGSFRRSVRLPEGVDADAIEANFDRGGLEVTIPKPERATPRSIAITVGSAPKALDGSARAAHEAPAQDGAETGEPVAPAQGSAETGEPVAA